MDQARPEIIDMLPRLRRFARVLTRSSADAEDLVQSAIERVLVSEHRGVTGTRLDSWLYKILQNLWIDDRRTAARRKVLLESSLRPANNGQDVFAERLQLARVKEGFANLSHDHQIVLAMVVIEGSSYEETARRLGVRPGTVMSRLARARSELSELVGRDH